MSIIRVNNGKLTKVPLTFAAPPKSLKTASGKPLLGGLGSDTNGKSLQNSLGKPLRGGLGSSSNRLPVLKPRQLVALDTETTGLDFWHGCRPFFVGMLWEDGRIKYWEWEQYIDPFTRTLTPPQKDLDEIASLITENDFVLHNTKVDTRALESLGLPRINLATCHDTLVGSHVLCSNEPHGLKEQALQYLDISDADQKALQEATNKARVIARQLGWAIAQSPEESQAQHPHFPATRSPPKEGWWVMDTWLLRAIAIKKKYLPNHPWWKLLRVYSLRDLDRTYGLHMMQMEEFHGDCNGGLLACYEERRRNLIAVYEMEQNGASVSHHTINKMDLNFAGEANDHEQVCYTLLGRVPPKVTYNGKGVRKVTPVEPNLNSSRQIQWYLFTKLGLKPGKHTKSSTVEAPNYATDKDTLNKLLLRFNRIVAEGRKLTTNQLKAKQFINDLLSYRKCVKSRDYLGEYKLRSMPCYSFPAAVAVEAPVPVPPKKISPGLTATRRTNALVTPVAGMIPKGWAIMTPKGWAILHFWFNTTGTDTTRLSSSQPNGQNISKGEKRDSEGNLIEDFNLRKAFGPMPGREWYSVDYSNIELRLFAYESGDTNLIKAFETGYSVHLIFAEVVYPEQFMDCRRMAVKQLIKEGKHPDHAIKDKNVLLHADTTRLAGDMFKKVYESSYYQWCKNGNFALIYGAGEEKANTTYHVSGAYDLIRGKLPLIDELMARKNHEAKSYGYVTLRPGCEYRLYVPHDRPHVAVNYFVQGRAGWCMVLALNRVYQHLSNLNRSLGVSNADSRAYKMIMTIHDELVFDFPYHQRNQEVIRKIKYLMELSGKDVQVPTPVDVELHTRNWGEGEKLKLEALKV